MICTIESFYSEGKSKKIFEIKNQETVKLSIAR